MPCTILYRAVLIYLYVGCMRKRITLHYTRRCQNYRYIAELDHTILKQCKTEHRGYVGTEIPRYFPPSIVTEDKSLR